MPGGKHPNYRISPGLYALQCPDQDSPVLVTCNFKLTFDTVRRELGGEPYWLLVVETFPSWPHQRWRV